MMGLKIRIWRASPCSFDNSDDLPSSLQRCQVISELQDICEKSSTPHLHSPTGTLILIPLTGDLQQDLIRDLRITNTSPTNMTDFKRTVRKLGITERIQSLTSCSACHFMIKEVQDKTLTVESTGRAMCTVYFLLQTWKFSKFCPNIIDLHLVIIHGLCISNLGIKFFLFFSLC